MNRFPLSSLLGLILLTTARADLLDGLLVYYPLDETSGLIAYDIFGEPAFHNWKNGYTEPKWDASDPGIFLNDISGEYLSTYAEVGDGPTNQLTIAARINPAQFRTLDAVVSKGRTGTAYGLLMQQAGSSAVGRVGFIANWNVAGGTGSGFFWSNATIAANTWHHVAVTYDGTNLRFYLDGVEDSVSPTALVFGTIAEGMTIGLDEGGDSEYFNGGIADVAVYDRALSAEEMSTLATQTTRPAVINSSYAGLWVGQAALDEVKEVATDTWGPAPANFQEKILLHVDDNGVARLLSQATVMKTRVTAPATPQPVIITDHLQLANFDGITQRGGKLVGQRFSSATLPFAEPVLLGKEGEVLSAVISLAAADPLNPFRHKYHPDLKNGFATERTLTFTLPSGDSPSDHEITGTFTESVAGLHKNTLQARGSITFTRVSTSGSLDPLP